MKKILGLIVGLLLLQEASSQTLNVATYNLRLNTAGDGINAWPNRKEEVKKLIRYHEFDIFGTQEGFAGQLKDLVEMPEYTYTGVGRDDGKEAGEHSAIVYRKDKFKLLEHGDFWLSQTPDKPSKGWDATCCNRICSWGKFKEVKSGKTFYFFSVHFDHQGVEARRQSGFLMVQKIKEIAKNTPAICVGDFNSTPDTEQIKIMQASLGDSYLVTKMPPYGPVGTFNGFKHDAPLKDRIDYIFVDKHFEVLKYAVLTDAYDSKYPSDHQPVVIKTVFK
ncbi:endonuclease/exonuclease/phosphatase family protein [Flectobacillus longus]|uniref:endonuclease/exonuclease/phosphatase family protein n=1 Tax=Flectobacillus longus TaxID=2984207 RepID=UPI0024B6F44D|nr:endonuclease/exonuclease/phosphatase family protein [Flectobacillus longus]MDI9880609.1 endonuclease/exonuclease/phosphatase family protein [Flectobacillus longus]